jgi:hypothetical protein
MRCFLMKKGRTAGVELLEPDTDEKLIEQSHSHFANRSKREDLEGFEVWDHARRVYTWPEEPSEPVP